MEQARLAGIMIAWLKRWLSGGSSSLPDGFERDAQEEARLREIQETVRDPDPEGEIGARRRARHEPVSDTHGAQVTGNAVTDALLRQIALHKQTHPMAGLKIGAEEVFARVMNAMKNERGVHVESLLVALGALAGYACQMSLREEYIVTGKSSESEIFVIVGTSDGRKLYFGDNLNRPLAESEYSVWSLAAAGAKAAGLEAVPDVGEYFEHVVHSLGTHAFGLPRMPEGHSAPPPIEFIALWQPILPVLGLFCDRPSEWPIVMGGALQKAIIMSKGVIDPLLALSIAMESAIAMSKIEPVA